MRKINKEQNMSIENISIKIKEILKKQRILEKQVNYLLRITNQKSRKEMLAQMGIKDGFIDINVYKKCIEEDMTELFDVNKTLHRYHQKEILKTENKKSLTEELLNGLEFT